VFVCQQGRTAEGHIAAQLCRRDREQEELNGLLRLWFDKSASQISYIESDCVLFCTDQNYKIVRLESHANEGENKYSNVSLRT
jgi:hypothetical protein